MMTRKEFMAAAAGAGLLAGCGPAAVPDPKRLGTVIAITKGPEDPDRVILGLVTATFMPTGDNHVWFTIQGGQVCRREDAEKLSSPLFKSFGTAKQLFESLRAKGVKVHI
ncbi:MAG TPA: hypothetical protein VI643_01685 [Planctomycetota bacterium]|nr:hypothetical protein [Planctomycetota bacterium]